MTQNHPVTEAEDLQALVVGGNIAGLCIAHMLTTFGYQTCLVEKMPQVGGVDASFTNSNGRRFDFGLHMLDFMRSELATRWFSKLLDGEFHKVPRRRGIVLRNRMIPYNAPPEKWPQELRRMLPDGPIDDRLGTEPPTRENLARYYGRPFVDMIFDEVLESYPSERRHKEFGIDESELMVNIYPWFFPKVPRTHLETNRSRRFHDGARDRGEEYFLYPKEGGFGTFTASIRRTLEEQGTEVLVGAGDLQLDIEPETQRVREATVAGRRFRPERVYWCAPLPVLGKILSREVPDDKPDQFVLGSFEFDRPPECAFHEILVADPDHLISRMSLPGKISQSNDYTIQLEFSYPVATNDHPLDADYWRETWMGSLRGLGIIDHDTKLLDFDFKAVNLLYNGYGVEGRRMPEPVLELPEESNIRPVLPTIRNINLSTRIPQFLRYMAAELTAGG